MPPCRRDAIDASNIESTAVYDGLTYHSYAHRCCCAGEGLFNTKLTGPGEVFLQSYSHGKFKNYAIEWYLGNRASAGLARFASRGGAAADPFGAPPAADTDVVQRRGNNAPAPVPAAAPMDRKGR